MNYTLLTALAGAPYALYATLLTGNYAADASSDCSGAANSAGYNLIGVTDGCSFTGDTAADRIGLTPLLLPLATDQRGVVRPQGATCDIGAVEVVPPDALGFLPLVRH